MRETSEQMRIDLQKLADSSDSLIMSFIAPDTAVKSSPKSYNFASITTVDLYNIEKEIVQIKKETKGLPKKLKLVVHTPGGSTFISTKIAKYLRSKFDDITAYVPYEASSGGTVLCLGADRIVMDEISNLTPIDPQIAYKGTRISVASYKQVIDDMERNFKTTNPDELYPPYSQLCNQLDPVVMKEMEKKAYDAVWVAISLLKTHISDFKRVASIAFDLVKTEFSHEHVIDNQEAAEIGLELDNSQKELNNLDMFKLWVGEHLSDSSMSHVIECYTPIKKAARVKRG